MARVIKKPGDLLRFPLSDGKHGYAQWLADGTARIFRAACARDLSIEEVLSLPTAFRVVIFKDTPNRYGWSKIGSAPIPEAYSMPQRYAKRDQLTGRLSLYIDGSEEVPATVDEVQGLETAAVWAHPHIVKRLEAELDGGNSTFTKVIGVGA